MGMQQKKNMQKHYNYIKNIWVDIKSEQRDEAAAFDREGYLYY